jgi:hypothetical protein
MVLFAAKNQSKNKIPKLTIKCKICESGSVQLFSHKILNKYEVTYYRCPACYFVQTEEPFWIEEAYQNALNPEDTGLFKRNEEFRAKTAALLFFLFDKGAKFVDFAGGYGIFTRMMRDTGFDFYWSDKYANNMMAKGFEAKDGDYFECVTAFEVFEHMVNPNAEMQDIVKVADSIIFSTRLIGETPPAEDWWYYGFNHGQHVSLYSERSLQILGEKFGLNLYTNHSNFHLLSKKKISPVVFQLLLKLSKYGLYPIINFFSTSKTDSDAHYLLGK